MKLINWTSIQIINFFKSLFHNWVVFLVRNDKKIITLVQTLGDRNSGAEGITIPKSCVVKIRLLKLK